MAEQRNHEDIRRLHRRRPGEFLHPSHKYDDPLTSNVSVLHRRLHPHRRRNLLQIPPQRLRLPHELRRLDPRHLLRSGHAHH